MFVTLDTAALIFPIYFSFLTQGIAETRIRPTVHRSVLAAHTNLST